MYQTTNQYKKKVFQSFLDVASSLKLIELNPILKSENIFKNENLASTLLYRSWYRTPTFFRKFYGNAIKWNMIKNNKIQMKSEFYERIATIQSSPFKNHPLFSDLSNILLKDQGHYNIIQNDEPIISIMVGQQLNVTIKHANELFNGHAVDFKIINQSGKEIFFEIKPGYKICREKLSRSLELIVQKLMEEERNTGLGTQIGLVFECSESSYEKVLILRKMIRANNLESRVILTHKSEANVIQDIIIQNAPVLTASDTNLETITLSDVSTKVWYSQPLNENPSFDSSLESTFYEVSNELETRYQYPYITAEDIKKNNGYETLQEGMLDELFKL